MSSPTPATTRALARIAGFTFALLASTHAYSQGCGGGNPCGGSGPATQQSPVPPTGAGNPVDVASGNKYVRETDFAYPGELSLEFTRHYNSVGVQGAGFGGGWNHSYETALSRNTSNPSIDIRQADGRRLKFRAVGATNGIQRFVSDNGAGVIEENVALFTRAQQARDQNDRHAAAALEARPWVWTWTDGRRLTFDARGLLKRIETADGTALNFTHDPRGRLARITDSRERYAQFTYWDKPSDLLPSYETKANAPPAGERNRIKAIALFDGRTFEYLYDRNGLLAEVRYSDGTTRRYEYALVGDMLLLGKRWGRDKTLIGEYAYDGNGRAVFSSQGEGGHVVRLEYRDAAQANGIRESVLTNGYGERTVYKWRASSQEQPLLLEATGPGCASCPASNVRYRYDANENVVSIEQLETAGRVRSEETFEYDAAGRLSARYEVREGQRSLIESYKYASPDPLAKPSRIERPSISRGRVHAFDIEYNERGQPIKLTESGFAPVITIGVSPEITRTTSYSYYASPARLAGKLKSIDGPLPGQADVVTYSYGNAGELRKIQHAGAADETFEYDTAKNLVAYTPLDGVRVQLGYDGAGRVNSFQRGGLTTALEYDDQDRVARIRDPIGQQLTLGYDAASRVTSISDVANNKIVLELDAEGRPTARRLLNPDGSVAQEVTSSPEEVLPQPRASWSPSALALIRLPILKPWSTRAEALIASANVEQLARSRAQVADERGLRSDYVHDDFGRLAYSINPDSGVTRYEYDTADRMVARHFADDRSIRYEYDSLGRPVRSQAHDLTTTLEYGTNGKPKRLTYGNVEETFAYDAAARLTLRTQSIDGLRFVTRYKYDDLGRLSETTLADGQTLAYRYNSSVHAKPGVLAAIERKDLLGATTIVDGLNDAEDRFDRQTSRFGNGLEFTQELNSDGKPVRYGTSGVAEYEFETDDLGRITLASGSTHQAFKYDEAGRLVGAATVRGGSSPAKLGFAFDSAHNLKIAQSATDDLRFRVDANSNRILSRLSSDGSEQVYRYDAAGRTVQIGARQFDYDGHGRLAKISEQGRPIAEYAYNAFGERIRKVAYSGTQRTVTYYFYDGSKLTAEADQSGAITKHFVYVGERAVAAIVDKDVFAIHTDWRGSPVALTDEDQRVVWRAEADVIGRVIVQRAAFEINLRGSNQYYDKESGLHYNTQRYFDPESSRYLSPDPLGQDGGLNLYAFVAGDPANQVDLLGMQATDVRNMSFGDKMGQVFRHAVSFVGADMRAGLQSAFDNLLANVATTAAIFAVWAILQATPIGWLVDAALIGLAYYEFGRAGIDIIRGLVAAFNAMNSATCSDDLVRAGRELANVFETAARVIGDRVNFGSKITSIFRRASPGARNVHVNANQTRVTPPPASQVNTRAWRNSIWRTLSTTQKGLRGELEVGDVLLSRGWRPAGNTLDPRTIRNQTDFDNAHAAYRGRTGIDLIYTRTNPTTGRTEFIIVESKALTNGTAGYGNLGTTNDGRQMSTDWILARLPALVPDAATRAAIERGLRSGDGSVTRALASTNGQNNTVFMRLTANGADDVTVGANFNP